MHFIDRMERGLSGYVQKDRKMDIQTDIQRTSEISLPMDRHKPLRSLATKAFGPTIANGNQ